MHQAALQIASYYNVYCKLCYGYIWP